MHVEKLSPGFLVSDTGYPSISTHPGFLTLSFDDYQRMHVVVVFESVAAYRWQEGDRPLAHGEPYDGACELFESPWLAQHRQGQTMHSLGALRHLRFNFNAWGRFEILCDSFHVSIQDT